MSKVVLPSHLEGVIRTATEADRSIRGRSAREELHPEPRRQLAKSKPGKRWTRNVLLRRNQTEDSRLCRNPETPLPRLIMKPWSLAGDAVSPLLVLIRGSATVNVVESTVVVVPLTVRFPAIVTVERLVHIVTGKFSGAMINAEPLEYMVASASLPKAILSLS